MAPPIAGLAGEVVCILEFRAQQRAAAAFERRHPNLFVASGAREAGHKSVWKIPGWEYRPCARFEKDVGKTRYVVEINSLGFRTHEFLEKKPPATVRVICVGGSTTVQGQTNSETYPAILERNLRRLRPSCSLEVLNFGISGTDSTRWIADSATLFRFEPDVVVQYDAVNDIMARALPGYARQHPWRELLSRSLLLERLIPIEPQGLDSQLSRIVDNQVTLEELCRRHGATHLSLSFAAPDYDRAPQDERAYLQVNLAEGWTSWPGTIHLRHYPEYAHILARYNVLFEEATRSGGLEGVLVHRALSDPRLFVDLCHMTQQGIAELAELVTPPVSAAVAVRCSRLKNAGRPPPAKAAVHPGPARGGASG